MSENKEIKKILISFSKDSDFVRKKLMNCQKRVDFQKAVFMKNV